MAPYGSSLAPYFSFIYLLHRAVRQELDIGNAKKNIQGLEAEIANIGEIQVFDEILEHTE